MACRLVPLVELLIFHIKYEKMNKIISIALILLLHHVSGLQAQGLHSWQIEEHNGNMSSAVGWHGKKAVLITVNDRSDTSLRVLTMVKSLFPTTNCVAMVLGSATDTSTTPIPSIAGVIYTYGLTNSTGSNGSVLQWLTNKSHNAHFDVAEPYVGYIFFIDEEGDLYGVLPSSLHLTPQRLQAIMTKSRLNQSN